ncbi:MAG: hypothetical protein ACRERY_05430 [Pseudomonas sp.]
MAAVIPALSEERMQHIVASHCRTDGEGSELLPSKQFGKAYFPTGLSPELLKGLIISKVMTQADRTTPSARDTTKHFYKMEPWFPSNGGKKVELCIEIKNKGGSDIVWTAYPKFY